MQLTYLLVLAAAVAQSNPLSYTRIFSDDFDRLDFSKWNVVEMHSQVNDELQWYSRDDVYVEHGFLYLRARNRYITDGWNTRYYSSGMVDTRNKFEFKYGDVEFRAKLPRGTGFWPAACMLLPVCQSGTPCGYWPPEIDILDFAGGSPEYLRQTVHYDRWPYGKFYVHEHIGSDFTADFHIFKVIWDADQITYYVDGLETFKVTDKKAIPNEALQLVIKFAVGGTFSGDPDWTTPFPSHMIIDWVRVYKWQ